MSSKPLHTHTHTHHAPPRRIHHLHGTSTQRLSPPPPFHPPYDGNRLSDSGTAPRRSIDAVNCAGGQVFRSTRSQPTHPTANDLNELHNLHRSHVGWHRQKIISLLEHNPNIISGAPILSVGCVRKWALYLAGPPAAPSWGFIFIINAAIKFAEMSFY